MRFSKLVMNAAAKYQQYNTNVFMFRHFVWHLITIIIRKRKHYLTGFNIFI